MDYLNFHDYGLRQGVRVIHRFIGGSQLHGAKLEGTDDTDWYGVFVEPPELSLGLVQYPHFVCSTGNPATTNTAADIDICMYSLKKWAGLAVKGNPSVLHFLFAPSNPCHFTWAKMCVNKHLFLASSHAQAFLGYAEAQAHKLFNKKPLDTNRSRLVEEHGYDTKYAMHMIRLVQEGCELMETGHITLPRPNREFLIDIRRGRFNLPELEEQYAGAVEALRWAEHESPLPDRVDLDEVSKFVSQMYLENWMWHRTKKFSWEEK